VIIAATTKLMKYVSIEKLNFEEELKRLKKSLLFSCLNELFKTKNV